MHVLGPAQLLADRDTGAAAALMRHPTRCDWFDGIDALLPCFARIVAAIDDAPETEIIAVTGVDAGDLGKPVPTGAMRGGDVAVDGGDVRRPLDDPAGIVAGQTPSWAGPVPGGIGRKRKWDQSECHHPAHREAPAKTVLPKICPLGHPSGEPPTFRHRAADFKRR